jgi:hypothetical protein
MRAFVHDAAHHATGRFRRRVLQLWESRGGGFYGFVAVLMLLYLETLDLAGDIAALPGTIAMDLGFLISWVVSNFVDFVLNMVWASIWPVQWLGHFGVGIRSGLLLGAVYLAYRLVRPFVLRLLSDPEAAPAPAVPAAPR